MKQMIWLRRDNADVMAGDSGVDAGMVDVDNDVAGHVEMLKADVAG